MYEVIYNGANPWTISDANSVQIMKMIKDGTRPVVTENTDRVYFRTGYVQIMKGKEGRILLLLE